jgi:hypothetical protein
VPNGMASPSSFWRRGIRLCHGVRLRMLSCGAVPVDIPAPRRNRGATGRLRIGPARPRAAPPRCGARIRACAGATVKVSPARPGRPEPSHVLASTRLAPVPLPATTGALSCAAGQDNKRLWSTEDASSASF